MNRRTGNMTHQERNDAIVAMLKSGKIDERRMFLLLREMIYATAKVRNLFKEPEYYHDFCNYMTDIMYVRLIDTKRPVIENIVGYLNLTVRGFFEVFSKGEFRQIIDTNRITNGAEIRNGMDSMFYAQAQDTTKEFRSFICEDYLQSLPKLIKNRLKHSRYTDPVVNLNIYTSVMLSMIRGTDTNFRLTEDQFEYMIIMKRRIFQTLGEELRETLYDSELTDSMVQKIISESGAAVCSIISGGEDDED